MTFCGLSTELALPDYERAAQSQKVEWRIKPLSLKLTGQKTT